MELVYMDGKKEPYTTSEIIAECAEVQHHTITRLIREHKVDFEALGILGFEIHKLDTRGQPKKSYILNEQQATLLITYLKNTEPVREFKKNLVKAFFELRKEVAEFRYQRALEKPKRKTLHDSIETWEQAPKHAHPTVNNLLLKGASGLNKKQLMAQRGGHNGIDSLTSAELVRYQALEDMAIAMINLDMSYQDIKTMVFRQKTEVAQ
ncbi:TPA: Rha family transcriptional regulator [Streptococcus suis]|uniref:Rha family transcriptional regulator n=1 Tax=Streptococcus TaxID=1301 RepID=UPI000401B381|nr:MULTISPECIES: Rha family transcriptional regulator [Streptococcus]MBM7192624.1 Rha family transcriptional regulator [Streptococcus suis]MBO4111816.1 Rha family transcriptional regulator [Streptococcus suis]MBY0719245.1 Rha family transcriptional regulator [Streptococcus sp. 2018110]MCO8206743.1 Rha family transcriptional regulator [Streptococcus suis]MCO8211097.1 Rha family transcriptional regulator [Streptococcus suis]